MGDMLELALQDSHNMKKAKAFPITHTLTIIHFAEKRVTTSGHQMKIKREKTSINSQVPRKKRVSNFF